MRYLLDLVYLSLLVVASPWLLYTSWRRGKYRQGLAQKVLGRVPYRDGERPCIWFHAVSVGEIILLQSLLKRMIDEFPGWECVISTTTNTGFQTARQRYPDHTVFYCPLDFSFAVAQAMRRVRPDMLVLSELELWPNLVSTAKRNDVQIAIVNGRLSRRSYRGYRRLGWLIRKDIESPRPAGRAIRCVCTAVPAARGAARSRTRHGVRQVRRSPNGSRQRGYSSVGRLGRDRERGHGLRSRQYSGA